MPKPHVICHMCTTIDAKILTSRWPKLPGHADGASLFESTASSLNIPAWLVGTTTMSEFSASPKIKLPRTPTRTPHKDHLANTAAKSFAIGTDAKGILRFTRPDVDGDHTIILTTTRAPSAYLAHLKQTGISYLLCGTTHINLPQALHKLHTLFKIKKLLLEGGGTFNASMLHARLVDEISQVVLPIADAGGESIPSLFHHIGPTPKKSAAPLRLTSHKRLPQGALWLRYKVLNP